MFPICLPSCFKVVCLTDLFALCHLQTLTIFDKIVSMKEIGHNKPFLLLSQHFQPFLIIKLSFVGLSIFSLMYFQSRLLQIWFRMSVMSDVALIMSSHVVKEISFYDIINTLYQSCEIQFIYEGSDSPF